MKVFRSAIIAGYLYAACGWAQGSTPVLRFSLDRPGPAGVQYTLSVDQSGTGSYQPHSAAAVAGQAEPNSVAAPGAKQIVLSPPVVKKLFAAVPMVEGGRCETHSKSIAKTGVKVLQFSAEGKTAECTYNYSDDDRVNEATQVFEAVAETLQYGDRLRAKLRFDRLGLDAELDGLQHAVDDQRALEVGNIAPVLQSIIADEHVMDRVRRKAEQLLQKAPAAQTAESGSSAR